VIPDHADHTVRSGNAPYSINNAYTILYRLVKQVCGNYLGIQCGL